MPWEMSGSFFIRLPIAVADVSARAVEGDITITASEFPKLKECPTVPEEVQIPRGVS